MNAAITIEHLTFTYRNRSQPALRAVEGQVRGGALVAVMGHAGAGKSTLCATLNALIPKFFRGDYQGRVLVRNQEVARRSVAEMSRTVGMVFQDFEAQLFSTNVELEIAFGPENHGLPRPEIERRIGRYLSLVGLERLRRREPATLSGGQKQRLAIGAVLASEPAVLVLDEPTTDLDPQGREEVLALMTGLREQGRTILIVDHEPETATTADDVWLMQDGRIVAAGPPEKILVNLPLIESCGIHPLPTVELFRAMGWPGTPLTPQAAIRLIREKNLSQPQAPRPVPAPLPRQAGTPLLEVEALRYVYPTHGIEALVGIDLAIGEGEFVAIVGQNGSGKTTLAKQFNGLLKPTSGRIRVAGKPTSESTRRELARRVGYVFQNPDHQIFAKTVQEEVGFGLKVFGEDSRAIEKRVSEVLAVVDLEGYEAKVPFSLTKGERQRVAVASVLAAQPQVLILDEPTTGLDDRQQRKMMDMLKRLHDLGHTILIITHSMRVAAEYAERILVMKEGRFLLDGPTRQVLREEAPLAEASLRLPPLIKLSNWLGTQAMTVQEMVEELKQRETRLK